jgi:hypothetical protein
MKRLVLCAVGVFAVGLALAPGALASTRARPAAPRVAPPSPASDAARLGATTYDISGHVLAFDDDPLAGAAVNWGWWDKDASDHLVYNFGGSNITSPTSTGTGADGAFAFTGVTGGSPWGDDLTIGYGLTAAVPGLVSLESWNLDFATQNDATPSSYEMRPGEADITVAHAPGTVAEVQASESDVREADTGVALTSGSGVIGVTPPSFQDVVVSFPSSYPGRKAEVESYSSTPVMVAAGATTTAPVALDRNDAQWSYLAGPLCRHSGKPGSVVTMTLKGWPADELAGFTAYYGAGTYDYATTVESSGAANTYTARLQVRPSAPVGMYEIDTTRADAYESRVDLYDFYQVCTYKASASSILPGHAVRLSGRVPGSGSVTIYAVTHKVSAAPRTLAASGWHKVGSCKLESGRFTSTLLYPTRTTWYVVKYSGYAFKAFTSVVKVAVR